MLGFCEYVKELSGSIKGGEFLGQLRERHAGPCSVDSVELECRPQCKDMATSPLEGLFVFWYCYPCQHEQLAH